MKLPYVPDLTVAKFRGCLLRQSIQTNVREENLTGAGRIQRAQNMEQRRLSCATLANNRQHFTFTNPERQVVKEHKVRSPRRVNLTETLNSEDLVFHYWMHPAFSLVQIHSSASDCFHW